MAFQMNQYVKTHRQTKTEPTRYQARSGLVSGVFSVLLIGTIGLTACDKQPENPDTSVDNQTTTDSQHNKQGNIKVVSFVVLGEQNQTGQSPSAQSGRATPSIRTLSGQVVSAESSNLSFESSGKINQIYVKVGTRVNKGDVLAEIDDVNYQLQLNQTQVQLSQTQAQLNQAKSKLNQANAQLNQAKSQHNQAKSQLNQAIDQRDKAEIDLKRREELLPIGAVSEAEVDTVRLSVQSAEEQIKIAQAQIQVSDEQVQIAKDQIKVAKEQIFYTQDQGEFVKESIKLAGKNLQETQLTAPYDGIITAQLSEVGQMASASTPIFSIASDSDKEVRVTVPESLMTSVGINQPMLVNFPAIGRQARGKVTEISNQAVSGSFPVIIRLNKPSSSIRSGMTAEVAFQVNPKTLKQPNKQNAINSVVGSTELTASDFSFRVPPSAIGASDNLQNTQNSFVYRIKQDSANTPPKLEKVPVVITDMIDHYMKIQATDGRLKAGDKIVRTGVALLQEGQTVELMGQGTKRVNP